MVTRGVGGPPGAADNPYNNNNKMLATMGSITLEFTGKLPSYLSPAAGLKFADIPNGLGALGKVPAAGWAQIVAYSASACCPMTSPMALPRPQATSASRC